MPKISNIDIAQAIYLATKDKTGAALHESVSAAAKTIKRRGLLSRAPAILESLEKIVDRAEGTVRAKVTSARKLHSETKTHLKNKLETRYRAKKIIFEEFLDENLLGGMRIEAEDEVIDLSLREKIKKLQAEFIK